MVAAALFFAILLASPILNANAYAAGGFSSLYLRQLSFHDSSLDKRQTIVCGVPGYSPCPDNIGCCPTGFACLPDKLCNYPCPSNIKCGKGCCMADQFCGSDDLCRPGSPLPPPPSAPPPRPPPPPASPPPPPPPASPPPFPPPPPPPPPPPSPPPPSPPPPPSSSSSSTTTSVLATAFVQTTATPGATAPPSVASGAPIGCMRLPSLLLLAIVIAHLGFFAGYGVF